MSARLGRIRPLLILAALAVGAVASASAQGSPSWAPDQAPKFLRVSADTTRAPVEIDPSEIPAFRHRIAMHLHDVSRRDALKEIARASGLQFVYASDVIPPDGLVQLQADDITVVAALTEILLGTGVDVAIGADGNAILVKRPSIAAAPVTAKHDIVRGRVTTDSGTAIVGADAIVTMAPTVQTFRTLTDSAGNYSIAITDGSGEYLLFVGAAGRKAFRQRLTRTGGDTTFIVNVKLAAIVTATLSTVRVQARVPRPARTLGGDETGTDGTNRTVDGMFGTLPPDLQGNLDAMTQLVPGLNVGANGSSAFGLSSGDNKTTLNGLAFGAPDLPRAALTKSRLTTSIYDPVYGGFSGFQNSTSINPGENISRRSAYLNFDQPVLQVSDPVARRIGAEPTNIDASAGGSGAISLEKLYYSHAVQLRRTTADASSLSDPDAQSLALAGVSPDSAARLLQILSTLHIPASVGGIPAARTTTLGSFIERIDYRSPAVPAIQPPGPSAMLTAYGRYSESDAQSLSAVAPPAFTGKTTRGDFMLQGLYSKYLGAKGNALNETTSSFSFSDTRGTPYLQLPSADVLISSVLADGTDALGALSFGGNSALASETKSWQWETVNQTNFLVHGLQTFPVRIYLQSLFTGFDQALSANRLGTFNYSSLQSISDGTPSSFSRTLNVPNPSGGEWMGAGAMGGSWKKGKLTLTGGARVDANVFSSAPEENPLVASTFGVRNDHEPNSVDVSPRLGFVWSPRLGSGFMNTQASTLNFGSTQIRGGIGKYRSLVSAMGLADPDEYTGLSNGAQRLLCTGSATPAPNWPAYEADPAAVPATCNGTSTFADTAPSVRLYGPSFVPAESWRASLGFTKQSKPAYFTVDASYSINVHQPGSVDLNFDGTPKFTLTNEDNRPVYVNASSIYPATGSVSPVQSRVSPIFGPVVESVSDLRSYVKQVTFYAIPNIPFKFGQLTFAYTYFDGQSQRRGFDQSTGGDPRAIESASNVSHHQFVVQFAHIFKKIVVTSFVRAQSGYPFTPLVAGDINGDGSSNDRAFVFNPATVSDPALASGMRTLLASAP
ncbi:MAG: carboxypeptidase-like regulatory domain-containing protein, partial [Gemmatimonadaceae bacterium]